MRSKSISSPLGPIISCQCRPAMVAAVLIFTSAIKANSLLWRPRRVKLNHHLANERCLKMWNIVVDYHCASTMSRDWNDALNGLTPMPVEIELDPEDDEDVLDPVDEP